MPFRKKNKKNAGRHFVRRQWRIHALGYQSLQKNKKKRKRKKGNHRIISLPTSQSPPQRWNWQKWALQISRTRSHSLPAAGFAGQRKKKDEKSFLGGKKTLVDTRAKHKSRNLISLSTCYMHREEQCTRSKPTFSLLKHNVIRRQISKASRRPIRKQKKRSHFVCACTYVTSPISYFRFATLSSFYNCFGLIVSEEQVRWGSEVRSLPSVFLSRR